MTEFNLEKQGNKKYNLEDTMQVLQKLIAPGGCPWDRVQTNESIRRNMIEEAYEAVDAIDSGDEVRMKDEFGDVLLQVLLHAVIAEKNEKFDFLDITDNLCRKMISRHTHIFGEDSAGTAEDSLLIWEKNKKKEKDISSFTELLKDLPHNLPTLMRAEKIQKRAAKSGFDWENAKGAKDKIEEEFKEIEEVLVKNNKPLYDKLDQTKEPVIFDMLEDEIGDMLFAVVNYIRLLGIDPEIALNKSNEKFIRRFSAMEKLAGERQLNFSDLSLCEMDKLWEHVKMEERNEIG